MVTSGYATHSFMLSILGIVQGQLSKYFSGLPWLTANLAINSVSFLIALGGLTVMLGGVAILIERITSGRILIMLGGGAGFLGFLLSFGYATYQIGLTSVAAYGTYWIGLVLAIFARRFAKRA